MGLNYAAILKSFVMFLEISIIIFLKHSSCQGCRMSLQKGGRTEGTVMHQGHLSNQKEHRRLYSKIKNTHQNLIILVSVYFKHFTTIAHLDYFDIDTHK